MRGAERRGPSSGPGVIVHGMSLGMQIWVDADACPQVIKEILFRAAERVHVLTTLVSNMPLLRTPSSPFIRTIRVAKGFDVADQRIARELKPGDLVITADIPLAADAIARGATALDPRGELSASPSETSCKSCARPAPCSAARRPSPERPPALRQSARPLPGPASRPVDRRRLRDAEVARYDFLPAAWSFTRSGGRRCPELSQNVWDSR